MRIHQQDFPCRAEVKVHGSLERDILGDPTSTTSSPMALNELSNPFPSPFSSTVKRG